MRPVFFKESSMNKKLSLEEIFRGRFTKLSIQEIFLTGGFKKELNTVRIRLINRIPLNPLNNVYPAIGIITPKALKKICLTERRFRQQILASVLKKPVLFLILSSSSAIPVFLRKNAQKNNISIAASNFDEHYLTSILKALLREKLRDIIIVHGNVIEAKGKGILITGASGIGKTTAALKSITKDNNYWVTDDLAVVRRNKQGELIARGHKTINDFIYTENTGIIPIRNLLDPGRIKKNTKLTAIIEVEKAEIGDIRLIKGEKEILGTKLTYLHIYIPSTRYLNENLLKKSLRQLAKDI
jgi:serine kinase of HPr protein (carbohydrate metabolism regulator)